MGFTKITNTELNSRGATTLPNQPTISATALKQEFDAPAKNVVAPKVNNLIDELEASTSATSLGATAPTGFTGSTVQAVLNSIGASASSASSQAHSHSNKAVIDKFSEDSGGNPLYDGNPIVSGGGEWGTITGDLADQTDLKNALDAKADTTDIPTDVSDLNNDLGFQTASDVSTAVATKSNVAWTQITAASGNTKIATITIDSIPTDVYAPTSGGGGGSSTFAGLSDVSLSGSPVADQIVQYKSVVTPDGTAIKLQNVNMPTIPTAVSQLSNDSGFQNASDVSTAISTAIGGLDVTTSGAGAGKTLSALSETDGKISATFQNISITKSQVSDFPAIPDELSDLTTDVAISSPTDGQVLTYDYANSKWKNQNPASGGHTMTPTPSSAVNEASIVSAINTAITEGGINDDVVSAYGVGKWSNVDAVQILTAVSVDDDGVGTWEDDDTWETSGVRTGWITHSALYGVLNDDDVEIEPVFKITSGASDAVSLYAMRIDDAVTGSTGGVAFKFNAPITANGYVGIRLKHLRTNTEIV